MQVIDTGIFQIGRISHAAAIKAIEDFTFDVDMLTAWANAGKPETPRPAPNGRTRAENPERKAWYAQAAAKWSADMTALGFPGLPPHGQRFAATMIGSARFLLRQLEAAEPNSREQLRKIIQAAIEFGVNKARLQVLSAEPHALAGKKSEQGRKKAHKSAQQNKSDRAAECLELIDKLRRDDPKRKITRIIEKVADETEVPRSTVYRYYREQKSTSIRPG